MAAAATGGARGVGVATGSFTAAELLAAGAADAFPVTGGFSPALPQNHSLTVIALDNRISVRNNFI
jgi:hypothetical protein